MMIYSPNCQTAGAIIDCDCDTCIGFIWLCPDCGASHQADADECDECNWVNPDRAGKLTQDYLCMCEPEAAANCWTYTESANTALEKKLAEFIKGGSEILMSQLKEVAMIGFVAGVNESKQ